MDGPRLLTAAIGSLLFQKLEFEPGIDEIFRSLCSDWISRAAGAIKTQRTVGEQVTAIGSNLLKVLRLTETEVGHPLGRTERSTKQLLRTRWTAVS